MKKNIISKYPKIQNSSILEWGIILKFKINGKLIIKKYIFISYFNPPSEFQFLFRIGISLLWANTTAVQKSKRTTNQYNNKL